MVVRRTRFSAAVAPLLALASCGGHYEHVDDVAFKARYTLPEGTRKLRVELLEGALTFDSGQGREVVAEVAARRASVSADGLAALMKVELEPTLVAGDQPGVVVLRGPQLPDGLTQPANRLILRTMIRVAPEIEVEGETGLGPVSAKHRRAGVRLETAHGPAQLLDCHGDAWLRTGRGTIIVDKHRGGLDIANGVWHGKPIDLRKDGIEQLGDIMQIFVAELGAAGIHIESPWSGVQCHVPAHASFHLDVRTGVGRGKNSFGIPIQKIPGTQRGLTMVGDVGGSGPPVYIHTGVGNISVWGHDQQ